MFVKDFSLPSLSRKRTMWTLFYHCGIRTLFGGDSYHEETQEYSDQLWSTCWIVWFLFSLPSVIYFFVANSWQITGAIEVLAWNQGRSEVCFGVHVFLDLCVHSFLLGEWAWHKHQTHVLRLVLSTEGYNSWVQSRNFVLLVPLKGFLLSKSSSI